MAQDRHILGAMALTNAAIVFTNADIEDPMERIFHAPVFPHGLGETGGITGQRGQEKALLDRDRTAHFAVRLDKANTGDIGPRALHA